MTYLDDIAASDLVDGKAAMKDYLNTLVGKIGKHHCELVDPKVQLYGDVGILTLHYRAWLDDGTEFPVWKATSVYHKRGDEWQVVHAYWSLVKPPSAQP